MGEAARWEGVGGGTKGVMSCFRVEAARVNLGRRRNNSFLGEKTVLICTASRLTIKIILILDIFVVHGLIFFCNFPPLKLFV